MLQVEMGAAAKVLPDDPRQQGRSGGNPKNPYYKALQEIKKSLMPFANEPSAEVNKHMKQELMRAGLDEVCSITDGTRIFQYWNM